MLNKVPEQQGVRACYGLFIRHNKQYLNSKIDGRSSSPSMQNGMHACVCV